MSSSRNIYLHGSLDENDGKPYQIVGNTVAEIIDGLSRQIQTLQPTVDGRQVITIADYDTEDSLYQDIPDGEDIHIFPVLGGDKGKFTQILIGTALIAVGMLPGMQALVLAGVKVGGYMAQVGFMLMLGGVAQLLAPIPETNSNDESSRYLGTPRNTVQIGTRIPILYGEYRWGGHYLSFDINASKN